MQGGFAVRGVEVPEALQAGVIALQKKIESYSMLAAAKKKAEATA